MTEKKYTIPVDNIDSKFDENGIKELKEFLTSKWDGIKKLGSFIEDSLQADTLLIDELEKRVVLLERVFGRLMQYDLRLDNLEFHSGQPMKPIFNEVLMDIKCRLERIEEKLSIQPGDIRNDE